MTKTIIRLFEKEGGEFITPPSSFIKKLKGVKAIIFDWDGVFNSGVKKWLRLYIASPERLTPGTPLAPSPANEGAQKRLLPALRLPDVSCRRFRKII